MRRKNKKVYVQPTLKEEASLAKVTLVSRGDREREIDD
jgi:hypothetical protein